MSNAEQPPPVTTPKETVESRAGDADREAVAERLRLAAGEGRIDLAELDERLGLAYAAKTYGELDVLVADLSQERLSLVHPGTGAEPETLSLKTTMQNIKQAGRWTVPSGSPPRRRRASLRSISPRPAAHTAKSLSRRCAERGGSG
jgi:hypothetical protein